ncbi:adenosine receptor A2b-like [Lycorma delicatula]|uniref:adenosine receptor A2b-like n=1 Tax=Lycorma delicatula TaxID=130591 RepID=UPI003F517B6F
MSDGSREVEHGLEAAPVAVAGAVLIVFILSPMILCGNSLILTAMYRYKRLRTPSNYLIASLASSDLGVGLILPFGMYLELTADNTTFSSLCFLPYCLAISLCSASVIVMSAIAVDRFTSLAQPLRYNNLITHASVERYITFFWLYAGLVGFSPLLYFQCVIERNSSSPQPKSCSFSSLIDRRVQLFLFCMVYGPSAIILLGCYFYIYIVARYHARAIYTVEVSLRQQQDSGHTRYGQTLAITVGLFIFLWVPFQVCMLMDVFKGTTLLSDWTGVYLALPIFASSAVNPWVYGYRNSEVRGAVRRVLEELLGKIGFDSPQYCPEVTHLDHAEMNSFASHIRLCAVSPMRCTSLLLPPGESSELTVKEVLGHDIEHHDQSN